jgi:peptidoglycan/xylan/chitin deacetylase (PgdA/CDA1 family)
MRRLPVQKPIILLYHRIADLAVDPWQLAVAPDHFEEQLAVLCKIREPLAMTEFLDRLEEGRLPANAVCITFDDGPGWSGLAFLLPYSLRPDTSTARESFGGTSWLD